MRGRMKLVQLRHPHSAKDLSGEIRGPVAALHFRLRVEEAFDHVRAGSGDEQADIDILIHRVGGSICRNHRAVFIIQDGIHKSP